MFRMTTTICFLTVWASQSILYADPPEKPRTRANAEDKATNLSRYVVGGFGQNATASLGIEVVFSDDPPVVTISSFKTDSPAQSAGLEEYDWIIEVDGSPVGKIRNRFYEPWQKYGRSGQSRTELLISYNTASGRKFYYPKVSTQAVAGDVRYVEAPDGFTIAKPRDRSPGESIQVNRSRYVVGAGNFEKYSPYELGAEVAYSYANGAKIVSIKPNSAAADSGLIVGDLILEVDGAPIGVFDGRTYEVWQQYKYSKEGKVEMLIVFKDANGELRYYYPEIQLAKRVISN